MSLNIQFSLNWMMIKLNKCPVINDYGKLERCFTWYFMSFVVWIVFYKAEMSLNSHNNDLNPQSWPIHTSSGKINIKVRVCTCHVICIGRCFKKGCFFSCLEYDVSLQTLSHWRFNRDPAWLVISASYSAFLPSSKSKAPCVYGLSWLRPAV